MKFKSNIGVQAGIEDNNDLTGDSGQILSSTGTGVAWIDQNAIGAATDFVFFNVKNETGSTILKGKGVMAVGTDGNSGHILIDEMVADGTVESKYFLGVLEEDIANGAFARVISFGQLSQFNTNGQNGETWADGQVLWCDPANPGDFTITEPDGPNVKIAAAFILNKATNGKIQVRVQANEGVHDLHDTKITSQVDGDVLVWDNTTGVWFNDSTLNVDYTNGRVGIGTDSPSQKLHIVGDSVESKIQLSVTGNTGNTQIHFGDDDDVNSGRVAYNHSEDSMSLYTNNSEKFRINSSGNVGIGTASPETNLQIGEGTGAQRILLYGANSLNTSSEIILADSSSGPAVYRYGAGIRFDSNNNILSLRSFFDGSNIQDVSLIDLYRNTAVENTPIRINYDTSFSGKVGIGTTSPGHTLSVNGTVSSDFFRGYTYPNNSFLDFEKDDTAAANFTALASIGRIAYLADTNLNEPASNAAHEFFTGATDVDSATSLMIIQTNGNVGIGTTSPTDYGATANTLEIRGASGTGTGLIRVSNADNTVGTSLYSSSGTGTLNVQTNHPLTFATNNNEKMRITSGGTLLLGDTNVPAESVWKGTAVFGQTGTDKVIVGHLESSTDGAIIGGHNAALNGWAPLNIDGTELRFNVEQSRKMTMDSDGNLGIGTTSPGDKLDVSGTVRANQFRSLTGTYTGTSHANKWQRVVAINYSAFSFDAFKLVVNCGGDTSNLNINAEVYINFKFQNNNGRIYANIVNYGDTPLLSDNFEIYRDGTNGVIVIYQKLTRNYQTPSWTLIGSPVNATYTWSGSVVGTDLSGEINDAWTSKTITNGISTDAISGNVGIGTTYPDKKLEIKLTETSSGTYYAQTIGGSSHLTGYAVGIGFDPEGYGNRNKVGIIVEGTDSGWSTGNMHFVSIGTTGTSAEATIDDANMTITSDGEVGIGTTSPQAKLDVKGVGKFLSGTGSNLVDIGRNENEKVRLYTDDLNTIFTAINDADGNAGHGFILDRVFGGTGANYFDIRKGGSSQLRIDSSGNVGIGTTSPSNKLHVKSDGNEGIFMEGTGNGHWFNFKSGLSNLWSMGAQTGLMGWYNRTDSTYKMVITDTGNVGIGTNSPTAKLNVIGDVHIGDYTDTNDKNLELRTPSAILAVNTSASAAVGTKITYSWANGGQGPLKINNASGEVMRIDSSGNVGIDTTNPSHKLHVHSGTDNDYVARFEGSTNNSAGVWTGIGIGGEGNNTKSAIIFEDIGESYSRGKLHLAVNNELNQNSATKTDAKLTISNTGNVGIGTASPNAKLEVSNDNFSFVKVITPNIGPGTGAFLQMGSSGANSIIDSNTNLRFYVGSYGEVIYINSSGNVGIGTTSPSSTARLHVVGNGSGSSSIEVDNVIYGQGIKFNRNGDYGGTACSFRNGASQVGAISIGTSSTFYSTSSDYRLKENLTPIESSIDRLMQLNPLRFNFISEPNVTVDGFLAHEVQDVVPESVLGEKDEVDGAGNEIHQSIDQSKLVPLLTAALQDAITKIEQLETRIQTLENND